MRIRTMLLALAACVVTVGLAACTSNVPGPIVFGKLNGETHEALIPFSAYNSGNPVIATEAHVASYAAPANPTTYTWTGAHTFAKGSTQTVPSLTVNNPNPQFEIAASGAPTDQKRWNVATNSTQYSLRTLNDAGTSGQPAWTVTRSGTSISMQQWAAGTSYQMALSATGLLSVVPTSVVSSSATNKLLLAKYNTGSGHSNAPKWNTLEMQYLLVGGLEYGAGTIRGIGFGYAAPNFFAPAFVGYQEGNSAGSTTGDLFFATRPTTTAVVPTERLRITAAGDVVAPAAYVPATANSLADKKYVDGRTLSPAAITAIKALTPSSTLADVIAALQK